MCLKINNFSLFPSVNRLISVWSKYRGTMVQLCLFEVISFLPPSEYSFYWSPLHGFKIVCFELNFHETEKKIKVSSSSTLHSMSFASLFSHTGLHIQNAISRDDGNERDKQRDGERDVQKERKEDLASFLSEWTPEGWASNHHAAVTSSHCHLTISASLLIVSLIHGSVLLPSM